MSIALGVLASSAFPAAFYSVLLTSPLTPSLHSTAYRKQPKYDSSFVPGNIALHSNLSSPATCTNSYYREVGQTSASAHSHQDSWLVYTCANYYQSSCLSRHLTPVSQPISRRQTTVEVHSVPQFMATRIWLRSRDLYLPGRKEMDKYFWWVGCGLSV